jgi:flagellar hook-basal body complex protein FliE
MIAVEEAGTAMEFMLEIRNKIVEAYQEIMRMPV